MKINQIIREKRKELPLTQEQLAERLGVTTSAVSKWEKGSTYPDITLLPPLARLLKIDLNTLMSFQDDLTDREIENFVSEVDKTVREQNYETAFQLAMDKIHEYPTCNRLMQAVIFYLEGALFLCGIEEPERYRKTFETYYVRLSESEDPQIRDAAISMLISYARNRGDFAGAEALIDALPVPPVSSIDKEDQLAVLYQQQKRYKDAEKIWEHRIRKGAAEIQTALLNKLEIALAEGDGEQAAFLADLYGSVTRRFGFPKWMRYSAHLQLAIARKDKEGSLAILQKMLPAMKEERGPQDCPLYRSTGNSAAFLSGRLLDTFCDELSGKAEYAFLRDGPAFTELLAQVKG